MPDYTKNNLQIGSVSGRDDIVLNPSGYILEQYVDGTDTYLCSALIGTALDDEAWVIRRIATSPQVSHRFAIETINGKIQAKVDCVADSLVNIKLNTFG